ncbi:MAG: Glu-tRNA(Gln) amidotransferase subunit GatD [Candidatus Methanomethylophilaceae archaeon]|nr:Glu-tRNA(Gln) amidotransferase subunit GatD [Candidatus Methanomethylophilaceae archaeon]
MTYSETLSQRLQAMGAVEGARLSVTVGGLVYEGTLMPHHQFSDPDVIVLKMKSGYNVGIRVGQENELIVIERPSKAARPQRDAQRKEGLKDLVLIGTGGTIASYVDYRTGAVHPALSTSDMVNAVPEIGEEANIRAKVLFSIFSENMSVQHWQELAEATADELNSGVEGVIIPHGTDTMGYTAAALSFMLGDINRPVTLVGAQRSSDRPSSDASSNLLAAARYCVRSDAAEVGVLMHDTPSDDHFALHRGTRVRKMHTSRRDAFQSINSPPLASLDAEGSIQFNIDDYRRKGQRRVQARTGMDTEVALLQY